MANEELQKWVETLPHPKQREIDVLSELYYEILEENNSHLVNVDNENYDNGYIDGMNNIQSIVMKKIEQTRKL